MDWELIVALASSLISSIFQGKYEVKSWAESEGGGGGIGGLIIGMK